MRALKTFNRRTYPLGEGRTASCWNGTLPWGRAWLALPALRRGSWLDAHPGRVLFLRTGAEGSVLAVNAGERPEPIDSPWPARDWMTGAALEQGEQTLLP